jgi:hypothetical protein
MLSHAADIHLGAGTENPHPTAGDPGPAPAPAPAPRRAPVPAPPADVRPGARVRLADRPDAPPGVRAGQPAAGGGPVTRALPLEDVGRLFGGGL